MQWAGGGRAAAASWAGSESNGIAGGQADIAEPTKSRRLATATAWPGEVELTTELAKHPA